jgi:hypothetical protein
VRGGSRAPAALAPAMTRSSTRAATGPRPNGASGRAREPSEGV